MYKKISGFPSFFPCSSLSCNSQWTLIRPNIIKFTFRRVLGSRNYIEMALVTALPFIIWSLFLPDVPVSLPYLSVSTGLFSFSQQDKRRHPSAPSPSSRGKQAALQLCTVPRLEAIRAPSKFTLHPTLEHQPAEAFGASQTCCLSSRCAFLLPYLSLICDCKQAKGREWHRGCCKGGLLVLGKVGVQGPEGVWTARTSMDCPGLLQLLSA